MNCDIVVTGTLPGESGQFRAQFATLEQARAFDELLHAAIGDAVPAGTGRHRADDVPPR